MLKLTTRHRLPSVLAIFAGVVLASPLTAQSTSAGPGDVGQFVNALNADRKAAGLHPVQVYWDLEDDARRQSQRMVAEQRTSTIENIGAVTTGWTSLREYEAVGKTARAVHLSGMKSAGYRGMVHGNWDYVGVGVERSPSGNRWVTVILMRACPNGEEGGS